MEFAVGVHMLDGVRKMAAACAAWISSQLKTPPSLLQPILVSYDRQHAHASASPEHGHVDRDFITCPVDVIQILATWDSGMPFRWNSIRWALQDQSDGRVRCLCRKVSSLDLHTA